MSTQCNLIENFSFTAFKWKHYNVSSDRLPKRALQGGTDVGGQEIYVGRALHNGVMLPAKVIPASNSAYVCKYYMK